MNHKTKSFIAVLLALCLMLSLGVGALADLTENQNPDEGAGGATEPGEGENDQSGDSGKGDQDEPHTITVRVTGSSGTVDVSMSATTGEVTKVDGKTMATEGTVVSLTVTADDGYTVTASSEDCTISTSADDKNQFSFTMPDKDVTISVNLTSGGQDGSGASGDPAGDPTLPPAGLPHTITIGVEPAGSGTVTVEGYEVVNGEFEAPVDKKVYFTVKAAPGYKFVRLIGYGEMDTIQDEGSGRYHFFVPDGDGGITAEFEKNDTKYDINIDNENIPHGTVKTDPEGPTVGGTPVKVTATPNPGYVLDSISVTETDGTPVTVSGYQFTMPNSAVKVTATFTEKQPQTHRVYVDAPHADFYSAGGSDYAEGAVVSFTVTPHRGYRVTGVWAGAAKLAPNSDGSYSFNMPGADITVKVECELVWWPGYDHWHSIDASYDGDYGYVTVDSWAYVGDTVYFTVHPYYDSWYYYDYSVGVYTDGGVKLDVGHYAGDTWYFTMPNDDVTVYAWFDWYYGDYSVSKSVEGDGSIYVRSWADHGDKVWIDAVPQSGASLTSLNVYYNGGSWWYESLHGYYGRWYEVDVHYDSARGEYYFYMPAHDVVVEAVFTTVGESITVVKPDNGSLKLSTLRAEKGDLVYITVDPDKGYELSELEVLSSLGKNVEVTELSENYYVFRMPGLNVKVKAEFRLSAYTPFADVSPNAWYFEAVSFVYDRGLMEGTSNYAFSPDADLSRGMLAAILYRMAGSPEVSGYSTFGDVPTTAYYARAIAWAQDHGIVTGVSAESYKPDSPVTREQLVAILSRYAQYKGYETSVSYDYLSTYGDASSASAYAREALNWAVARGVIDGQSGGVLAPTATASRAEVAQVLMNYLAVYT